MQDYSPSVRRYLSRLYGDHAKTFSFQADTPEAVQAWQTQARPKLRHLIGLDTIAGSVSDHRPRVQLDEREPVAPSQGEPAFTRQRGRIETEPDVWIPFWLLRPEGEGPFPLAIAPHGHDKMGYDTHAGIAHDDAHAKRIVEGDRDVAVQAVREGSLAIAPATRGLGCDGVPDINERHGKRDCRSQLIHCLLANRTPMGERVWDMQRIIDWATEREDVDPTTILMLGNSGGGVVTLYAAACDTRISIAVPSCSYCTIVGLNGLVHHCDCNAVPGIMAFGGMHDVAGLVAPRAMCVVNGAQDHLFPVQEVDRAVVGLCEIYAAAGALERFAHRYGAAGHRFYADLMWPFIRRHIQRAI